MLIFWVVVILAGCRPRSHSDDSAPNTTDLADIAASSEQAVQTAAPPVDNQPNTDPTDVVPAKPTDQVKTEIAASAAADELTTASTAKTIAGSRERLLLFAPDGPLLIEFVISVSGRPLNDWMQSILDDAMQLADTDNDGRTLWSEVAENDALIEKYINDNPAANLSTAQLKRRYDLNQNDVVDRHELPRLLTGGMSGGQSFGVRGSNYYREVNRFGAPVFRYLDQDTDGELVAAEIETAATRLRARDFDQDEYIELSDLSLDESPRGEALFRKDEYGTAVAVWLGPRNPWSAVRFGLSELYADGESVGPASFALTPELFGQLDSNQDGRLLLKELAGLKEIPPHVVLAVRLGAHGGGQDHLASVSLCASLQSAGVQLHSEPPWLSLLLPQSRIDFFARDLPQPDLAAQADERLDAVDADDNQYIDKDEFAASEFEWDAEFDEIDADGNAMIFRDELLAHLQADENVLGSQVHVRVGHQADALFAALDSDRDGRISPREVDRTAHILISMDRDEDGVLVADEIPDRILVGLTRGSDQQANDLFSQLPRSEQDQPADIPDWFQSMDQNRDNLLSRREFLGTEEQFSKLDMNQDGYVDANECVAGDDSQPDS